MNRLVSVTRPFRRATSCVTSEGHQMRKIFSLALAATAVAAAAMSGASAAATLDTVAAAPDSLGWGPCPQQAGSQNADAPRLECATLGVPLDYRDPGGRQIEIAVSRLASKDPSKRRGVLL